MNTNNLKWISTCQSIDWAELSELYRVAPLGDKPANMLEKVFYNSMFKYFVYEEDRLIGVGRALADGMDSAYLCDIAVHPDYQGIGLGKAITQKLLADVQGYSKIILFASMGKSGFYEKLGFSKMTTAMAIFKNQDRVREMGLVK